MDSVDVVKALVSSDRQQELGQARELVRAWRRWNPQAPDDDIARSTLAWTGWDVAQVLPDSGQGHGELDHHGRVICAIAILGIYFHNGVREGRHMLAQCLRTWDDFELFRLFWLQHQDRDITHAREFEELARTMELVGPIAPLRKEQLADRAFELDSYLHPILGWNVPGTWDPAAYRGGPLALPSYLF